MLKVRPKTDTCIIHCAATRPSQDVDAAWCDREHRRKGYTHGIGYQFFIKRDGAIEQGRPLFKIGAHALGWNARAIGVCMAGGIAEESTKQKQIPENNFTDEQWQSLETIMGMVFFLWPSIDVDGHRVYNPGRDCPCFDVKEWLETARPWKHMDFITRHLKQTVEIILFRDIHKVVPMEQVETPVGLVQTILKIPADCVFGPKTEEAVMRFQKEHGLVTDGIVGPKTWDKLLTVPKKR